MLTTVKVTLNVSVGQIWSSDAEQTHSPPSNLVMKKQAWHLADNMKTTLLDANGEVILFCLVVCGFWFCLSFMMVFY